MAADDSLATPIVFTDDVANCQNQSNTPGLLSHSNVRHLRRQKSGPIPSSHPASDCSSPSSACTRSPGSIHVSQSPYEYDPWDLVPYHVPWGNEYENYRSGAFPGRGGDSVFLRSPTPCSLEQHSKLRTMEACKNCRARKSKCSGTRPACSRCIVKGLPCQYVSDLAPQKNHDDPRGSVASPKPPRVDDVRLISQSLSSRESDLSVVKELQVKNEELDNDADASPSNLVAECPPINPASMTWDFSTTSSEGESDIFGHVNTHTSCLPSLVEGDGFAHLAPYPPISSFPHGESISHDDSFSRFDTIYPFIDSTLSVTAPRPIAQGLPMSLLEMESISLDNRYESAEHHQTCPSTKASGNTHIFAPSSEHQSHEFLTLYNASSSAHISDSDVHFSCDNSSLYAPDEYGYD